LTGFDGEMVGGVRDMHTGQPPGVAGGCIDWVAVHAVQRGWHVAAETVDPGVATEESPVQLVAVTHTASVDSVAGATEYSHGWHAETGVHTRSAVPIGGTVTYDAPGLHPCAGTHAPFATN
jgi:hypothetical protein